MLLELPVVNNLEPKGSEKSDTVPKHRKKPDWLRVKLPIGEEYKKVRKLVDTYKLHTICQSGHCPNMGECWGEGTATFMILGNVCTRSCSFCAVATGRPPEYDENEPQRVAEAISLMQSRAVSPDTLRSSASQGRRMTENTRRLQFLIVSACWT